MARSCRHAKLDMGAAVLGKQRYLCFLNPDTAHDVLPETCRACGAYASKYIRYPVTVNAVRTEQPALEDRYHGLEGRTCRLVLTDSGRELTGIFLGCLPDGTLSVTLDHENTLSILPITNPAFWVPDLDRTVWGHECWWQPQDAQKGEHPHE